MSSMTDMQRRNGVQTAAACESVPAKRIQPVFCGHGGGGIRQCMLPDKARKSECQFFCEEIVN